MKNLPFKLKMFLLLLYSFTIASIVFFVHSKTITTYLPGYVDIIFFTVLLALAESFVVAYRNMSVSASFAIHLAAILLFKPWTAMIIILLGSSLRIAKYNKRYIHILNTPIYRTLYNYSAFILPTLYGGVAYSLLGGTYGADHIWSKLYLIFIFSIIYFFINTFIASILFAMLNNKSVFYFFIGNAKLGLLSSIAMAPFGLILAFIYDRFRIGGVLLILAPIVLARYTFSLYIESKTQYIQTVDSLMRAMEARDKYTEGHSQRVAEIASNIAKELKYSDIKIEQLNIASLLHDVGKIGIDDNILNKPGKLSNEEYEIIKKHPEIGYNILKNIKNLEGVLPVVRHHHEKYNGKGYPDGKNAEELPLDVFIIQLADSIDAMATDRPYRNAMTQEQIVEEVKKYSGTQFHPKIVEAYLNLLEKQKKVV